MKRAMLAGMLLLAVVALTACGGRAVVAKEEQRDAAAARLESIISEAELISNDEVAALAGSSAEPTAESANEAAAEAPQALNTADERPIDLDLTTISGTVVYSQVYDMMMQPEAYTGQKIKLKGSFVYYQDPDTQKEYFSAVIADATACCAQGIEFVWKGEHTYPRDYPPIDTEITVTGIFGSYEEDGYSYIQLAEAEVEWQD